MNIIRALLVVLGCLTLGEAAVWILGVEAAGQHCRHGFAVCRASGRLGQIVLGGRTGGHFDGEPDFVFGAALRGRHQLFGCDCKRLVFDFDGHHRQYGVRVVGYGQGA